MKILFVTGSFPPQVCGVGDYTASLANALARQQNDVVVVTTALNGALPANQDRVRVHHEIPSWGPACLGRLAGVLRRERADIVHLQYPTQGFLGKITPWFLPLYCWCLGNRIVQTWHEGFGLWRLPLLLPMLVTPSPVVVVRPNFRDVLGSGMRWITRLKHLEFIRGASSIPRAALDPDKKRQLRSQFPAERRLVVFFGFIYPAKGVHRLFTIADPSRDHIVVAGAVPEDDSYLRQLKRRAEQPDWQGHVSFVGELAAEDVAALLAIADAAIFPFEAGGGEWNSSLQAAILNEVFVVTSSQLRQGYDADRDTYFAEPGDDDAMAEALRARFAGELLPAARQSPGDEWERIARHHIAIYNAHAGSPE